jgi:hypothetical protein
MSDKIFAIYAKLFARKDEFPKNKEGIIQILFDVRFLFDILSGRKELKEHFKDMKEFVLSATKPESKVDADGTITDDTFLTG